MQVYAGLPILTGAASAEEQAQLEHRLLGFVPITESFSVGEYMPLAHAEVDAALEAGRRPLVVGGTGLYLRAALTDLDLRPPPDPALRAQIHARMESEGPEALRAEVLRRAPGATIAPGDRNRIIRYLELLEMGETTDPGPDLWTSETRHPTTLAGLVMDRDALVEKIDTRMEAIAAAAGDEVRAADAAGASETARKAVGFSELLDGDVEAMKLRARQFARRQMTWMRKLAGVNVIDVTRRDPSEVAAAIVRLVPPPA
ncbi:MAG: tRNA dimethylallyltransferase [Thermoleophilaceae bacterium]|nr:tRNA dimethylallyltransferase [Thermoleophilaceae bacterium]